MKTRRDTVTSDNSVLLDHVKELRLRLIISAAVLVVGGIIGYFFYEPLLQWLKSPLNGDLYYTSPAGSFNFIMKVAGMVGIALAIPVIVYQIIMFIRPALPKVFSIRRIVSYTGLSVALAVAGAAFGFYMILPGALRFFAGFQVDGLSALIGADSYLSFVTNVIVTFMLVFQLPLLLVIIDHINPISPRKLLKAEKYVILGGLLVSFFVPFALDITTSLLIALPIVVLYNISIVMIVWKHAFTKKKYVTIQTTQRAELAIDDALIEEFLSEKSEKVPAVKLQSVPTTSAIAASGFKGLAMEFQKNRHASIEELRQVIESERALAIAEKVAQYNASVPLRRITDIR